MTATHKTICLLGLLLVLFLTVLYMTHGAAASTGTNTTPSASLVSSQHLRVSTSSPTPSITAQTRYSVVGAPSISANFINQVLAAYGSPAVGKGQALYDLGVKYDIDPAFALAFFRHESNFGKFGEAHASLSLGNLRCIPDAQCTDNYAWFPTWEAGFEAWYKLIRTLYVDQWHFTTVAQIIPRYAPTADHNNEAAYIASVEHSIDLWREGKVTA